MTTEFLRTQGKRVLLPALPEFFLRGRLLYQWPALPLLRGCYFETSAFSKGRFAVHMFVQPLYVPADSLNLTFGRRLGSPGEKWWELVGGNAEVVAQEILSEVRESVLPLFAAVREPGDFSEYARRIGFSPDDERALEAIAYSRVLSGECERARADLARLCDMLAPGANTGWIRERRDRARDLLEDLRTEPEKAVARLNGWQTATLHALKLG